MLDYKIPERDIEAHLETMPQLELCPFCGGMPEFDNDDIRCVPCGLFFGGHDYLETTALAWNTRMVNGKKRTAIRQVWTGY